MAEQQTSSDPFQALAARSRERLRRRCQLDNIRAIQGRRQLVHDVLGLLEVRGEVAPRAVTFLKRKCEANNPLRPLLLFLCHVVVRTASPP